MDTPGASRPSTSTTTTSSSAKTVSKTLKRLSRGFFVAKVNFKNRTLYHGDNLEFLRGMNSNTVHLIATDPPFKKGRDFHATPTSLASGARFRDRWRWDFGHCDVFKEESPKIWAVIEASRVSYGEDMGAFLCFMGVRLREMHRVLREDGSFYLHCDPTASHYLKQLMDAVFGKENFRNEIVWCYKSGGASPTRHFSKKHDILLFYSKTSDYTFNGLTEKSYNRDLRPYGFRGVEEYKDERGWYTRVGMKDYWEIDMLGRTSRERTGYPTQKPLGLYERIIEASSVFGDWVLDPFCGCGTTLVAAEGLGRRWVGIDIWDKAEATVLKRLKNRESKHKKDFCT